MSSLFLKIVNMSIAASWLILAVVLLRVVLKKAPKWIHVMNICLCIIKLIIVLMKSRENSRFLPSMKELTQERLNKSFLPGRK